MSDSFVTPWTVAYQAPLAMEISRGGYWLATSFSRGIFQTQRLNPCLLPCRWILFSWAEGEAQFWHWGPKSWTWLRNWAHMQRYFTHFTNRSWSRLNSAFEFQKINYICRLLLCVDTHTYVIYTYIHILGFPGGTSGKDTTCQCRRQERFGFNPWVGRSPGEGHGNLPQNSCLKNTNGLRSLADYSS